ncbi:MAG: hypothetical protein ACXQTI_06580 [Candidatus Nezhaarchaeales archaeon]
MSSIFKVELRKAQLEDIIYPEDHNSKVDAVKEIVSLCKEAVESKMKLIA